MNTIGRIFRFTNFGESHGPVVGGVIDGMPAGLTLDIAAVQAMLDRRRPDSATPGSTSRREADRVRVLSGLFEGTTTGAPIAFTIDNTDARSVDYEAMRAVLRPGHADATYQLKYGIRDYRGGGRASARATAATVAAGAMAAQLLESCGIQVSARVAEVGGLTDPDDIERLIERCRADGDSAGGIVECVISGVPAGLGEPVFGKLQSMLAAAMLAIPAAKGFEYGMGFAAARALGSECVEEPVAMDSVLHTRRNIAGGILGGISTGEPVRFRVAFKPVSTLMRPIPAVSSEDGSPCMLQPRGRHDVCVVHRAVPVVEASAALVVADALLIARAGAKLS